MQHLAQNKKFPIASDLIIGYCAAMKITDAQIIDALGGATVVAQKFGIPRETVQTWKHRKIPSKYRVEDTHRRYWGRGLKLAMRAA